jgi:hypothetical protein
VSVRTIYIAWKKTEGSRRSIIAKIKRNASQGITFAYCEDGYKEARDNGLEFFFGFKNAEKLTAEQVEHLLSQRVISKERPDRNEYLSFWDAEGAHDTFELLALTQGKSPTDNFEFLADYHPKIGLRFVTDLAGISHKNLPKGSVKIGDILTVKKEPSNPFDKKAVAVYKGDLHLGYIKQIHKWAFLHKKAKVPTLKVKGVDENGKIKQIFVSVKF